MDNQGNAGGGHNDLHEKAREYVNAVMESVRHRQTVVLHPGMQIIAEMITLQSVSDALFLASIYYDDPNDFVASHHVNVAVFAVKMAAHLGWNEDRQLKIGIAALLHDVGVDLVPNKLLCPEDKIDDNELLKIIKCANYTFDMLTTCKNVHANQAACALHVNARSGGPGRSLSIDGDDINAYAHSIGLLDLYEALIHTRPQRKKMSHVAAVTEIARSGKNTIQTSILSAMVNIFSGFPVNSYVRLNTNAVGRVIEYCPAQPLRPNVQIIFDVQETRPKAKQTIDLRKNPQLLVVDAVSEKELQRLFDARSM